MTETDPNVLQEQQRVNNVLSVIDTKLLLLKENAGGLKKDIIELRRTFWDDVTVNLDEPDDVGETFTSIKQQKELLAERERSHGQYHKQLNVLNRLKYSPYFGRVDFIENGEETIDKVYIGIASLMDQDNENFLIYDWRAPISSLYYDYSPGSAMYNTPSGLIEGDIELKRQFIIKNGAIKAMFNTGVTIGDELLQEVLGNQADTHLKTIVSTIQKEQNKIIRNERSQYLIVQGVAGSGKTSAALQRVAYLLYRFRESLNSNNIMLFSPNPLFNSYVATVLPELGEENMEQMTFQQYLYSQLGGQFEVETPFQQMEYLLTAEENNQYNTRLDSITFKASTEFKEIIDEYINFIKDEGLLFKNITFRGKMLIASSEIHDYFYSIDKNISIPNRVEIVAKWLIKELRKIEREERKKDWVIEESELLDREDYLQIYQRLQKKNQFSDDSFDDFDMEQKLLGKEIVHKHFRPIKKAIKQHKFIDMKSIYRQFYKEWDNKRIINKFPSSWKQICELTLYYLDQKMMMYEDSTPYLYLQNLIKGRNSNTNIRQLFIDEAQDYSPFQLAFLQQLFPNSRMTILGDLNQAIYAHSINGQTLLNSELYDEQKQEKIVLTKSYRSTRPIVEFTKGLVAGGDLIEAFNRDGKKPTLTIVENEINLHSQLVHNVKTLQEAGHETIALICKTEQESKQAYQSLQDKLEIRLLDLKTFQFEKGVLVLPAYLAKGIEFDAVILYDVSEIRYGRELDLNLFYTACTRAMHELHLFSVGKPTVFLDRVKDESYESIIHLSNKDME